MEDTLQKVALELFSVRGTPLLSSGSTMKMVTRAPRLWMHVKVYADGGENGLHSHPKEDHLFFVLKGQAIFFDAFGGKTKVGANEGVTIPRGTLYSFRATGEGNLVLLRIGSPTDAAGAEDSEAYPGVPKATLCRNDPSGVEFGGDDKGNKTGAMNGVPSGQHFGV
jgi:mannose-6-phosphate isomerase-like protein (cupin superfamily)